MPLKSGSSPEIVSQNISELHSGKTFARTMAKFGKKKADKQSVAIALSNSRKGRKDGGKIPHLASGGVPWFARQSARNMVHTGPIGGIGPGRKDIHNMNVPSGAYVLPAESISHLGQSNTAHGLAMASHMFGASGPYGSSGGPYGVKIPSGRGGGGTGTPKPPKLGKLADGGATEDKTMGMPVPIKSASGEFVIDPSIVKNIGEGSLEAGHKSLDRWVMKLRAKHIATLKKLPKPAQS